MKIRSLEISNFRKFTHPIRVSGFADGINTLVGPNEMGKSTVLAAIRGLLFERYKSRAEAVERMQPTGSRVSPVLAMDFEIGEAQYRIEKRFLGKEPYARLRLPGERRMEGEAAEEELQRLLGFSEPGKRGASNESTAIWGVLWVEQGASFYQPEMGESARRTLESCLDTEVGLLAGGKRGQKLIEAAASELSQHQDGRGNPKGRLKDIIARIEEVDGHLLPQCQSRRKLLSGDVEELERVENKIRSLNTAAEDDADQKAIAAAEELRKQVSELQLQIEAATNALALAQRNAEGAEAEQERRSTLGRSLVAAKDRLTNLEKSETDARTKEAEADAAVLRLKQGLAELEQELATTDDRFRRAQAAMDAVRIHEEFQRWSAAFEKAREVQNRINALSGQLAVISIDAALLKKLKKAKDAAEGAESALRAVATRISFKIEPEAAHKVKVAGASLPTVNHEITAIDNTPIDIEGVGRIVVRPVVAQKEELEQQKAAAQSAMARLLRAASVENYETAEAKNAEREDIERQLALARAELDIHAPGDGEAGTGVDGLEVRVQALGLKRGEKLAACGLAEVPREADAEAEIKAAERARQELRGRISEARAALAGPETTLREAQGIRVRSESDLVNTRSERDRIKGEIEKAVEKESDDALDTQVIQSRNEREQAQIALTTLQSRRTGDTVETLNARIQRLRSGIKSRLDTASNLKADKARLEATIVSLEGQGLAETIERYQRELEQLKGEKAYIEREVEVLDLLLTELEAAEREAKERYIAPVVSRIHPYLRYLFPRAELVCDENFVIKAVARGEGEAEDFDNLSGGTQEQIAVLTRLAFAEMLVEKGMPATVILDDALAYSDTERLERMFDILTQAAKKTQIIVLSCRDTLFDRLGGRRLTLEQVRANGS